MIFLYEIFATNPVLKAKVYQTKLFANTEHYCETKEQFYKEFLTTEDITKDYNRPKDYFMHKPVSMSHIKENELRKKNERKKKIKWKKNKNKKKQI